MQSVLSRIWTRVVVSISYDDNHYTTGTSIVYYNNCFKIDATMIKIYYGKKNAKKKNSMFRKRIQYQSKKHQFDFSNSKSVFLQDELQMTAIALVSVINNNQING